MELAQFAQPVPIVKVVKMQENVLLVITAVVQPLNLILSMQSAGAELTVPTEQQSRLLALKTLCLLN